MIIEAKNVKKIYRSGQLRVEALADINIEIVEGEMVAIMGPSGCGKTTLLNCLSGLDTIDEGDILIRDKNLRDLSDSERTSYRAQNMGFIFQDFNLLPVLTAVENIELPMLISKVPARKARKRALEMLDIVGLSERAWHRPAELSGGQRQRVTIARALQGSSLWTQRSCFSFSLYSISLMDAFRNQTRHPLVNAQPL